LIRFSRVYAVFKTGSREPARMWGTILLCLFGAFVAFAVGGCAGCGNVVVQGKQLTPGEIHEAANSVGFYLTAFYSVGACGLLSIGLLSGELANGSAAAALARPISRAEYLAGRAALALIPGILVPLAVSLAFAATLGAVAGSFGVSLVVAALALIPNLIGVGLLSGALGLALPGVFGAGLAWTAYAVSAIASLETVRISIRSSDGTIGKALFHTLDLSLPPFGRVQQVARALLGGEAPLISDWLALPWLLGYLLVLMVLTHYFFRRRDA
jgi:ABC-type transport system involved in multi-copper enzyme maturation permease subunit